MVFHTDRGSTYTANAFTKLCCQLSVRQLKGRIGSHFNNAAAEEFFNGLGWEVLSRQEFDTTHQDQVVVLEWCYGSTIISANTARRECEPNQLREHRSPQLGSRIERSPLRSGGTTAFEWMSAWPCQCVAAGTMPARASP